MDGSPAEGWEDELGRRLESFLARLRRKTQRHWAPFYVKAPCCTDAAGIKLHQWFNED